MDYDNIVILEKLGKAHVNINDFIEIYGENQDASLEFNSISEGGNAKNSLNSMINAVKTFDHQGTGYISINELKFSKQRGVYVCYEFIFLVLTGLGDKLKDEEFENLRQFMEISPNGQVSYERKHFYIFIQLINDIFLYFRIYYKC